MTYGAQWVLAFATLLSVAVLAVVFPATLLVIGPTLIVIGAAVLFSSVHMRLVGTAALTIGIVCILFIVFIALFLLPAPG